MGKKQRRHDILMRLLGAGANIAGQAASQAGAAISAEVAKRKESLRETRPDSYKGEDVTNRQKSSKISAEGDKPFYDLAQRKAARKELTKDMPKKGNLTGSETDNAKMAEKYPFR